MSKTNTEYGWIGRMDVAFDGIDALLMASNIIFLQHFWDPGLPHRHIMVRKSIRFGKEVM